MRQVKVCMLVHQEYYGDARVQRYAEALVDSGAQVDVLCVTGRGRQADAQRSRVRVFTIPLGRLYGGLASYFLEYGVALVLYTLWLLRLYAGNRYHIIHVHNMPDFLIFAALIPRLFGARLILDIHDPMPEFYMSKYKKSPTSRMVRLMRTQEKLSLRLAHAVITANEAFKDRLVSRGIPAAKITVVNNLPDPKIFDRARYPKQRRAEGERFTLIYPGTVAPRYGLDVVIRALPPLVAEIPQLRFVIIGPEGEHTRELTALAQRLGVASMVEFRPFVSTDQIPQHIAQADAGVYPALPDPHMSIAVPSKVLEYAVMGVPIIASRSEALERIFPDSAIQFFAPGDVAQFTDCVLALYRSPARREQLVRDADHSFVRSCSWTSEQQKYLGLLSRLLP